MNHVDRLRALGACWPAIDWASTQPDAITAWRNCDKPEWLFWLAPRIGATHQQIVLAACACARTALRYIPEEEERPLMAIEAAEAWARGEVSIEEVSVATAGAAAYALAASRDAARAAIAAIAASRAASAATDTATPDAKACSATARAVDAVTYGVYDVAAYDYDVEAAVAAAAEAVATARRVMCDKIRENCRIQCEPSTT
jgi:hypothetical protein